MTKLDLTATEPEEKSFVPFFGAFKGVVQNVVVDSDKDKNGNPFYKINAEVVYGDKGYTKKFFGFLPFDWKDESKPFGSLYIALGTVWENLLANLEKETHKDVVVLIGAGKRWQTKETKTYVDNNGKTRISYEVVGFAPYNLGVDNAWTEEMTDREEAIVSELNEGQQVATAEDINTF